MNKGIQREQGEHVVAFVARVMEDVHDGLVDEELAHREIGKVISYPEFCERVFEMLHHDPVGKGYCLNRLLPWSAPIAQVQRVGHIHDALVQAIA